LIAQGKLFEAIAGREEHRTFNIEHRNLNGSMSAGGRDVEVRRLVTKMRINSPHSASDGSSGAADFDVRCSMFDVRCSMAGSSLLAENQLSEERRLVKTVPLADGRPTRPMRM